MTTEPIRTQPVSPELLAYLLEQQAAQQQTANLPALYQQPAAPAVYPVQSRMFPELMQPVQQTVIVQRFDVKAQRMAGLALLFLCGGGGVDLAGHGIEAAGTGMWALAGIFGFWALGRIFAPRHTVGARSTTIVLGSHNRIQR